MTQSYFLREELVGYFVTHGFWYSVSSFNCLQFKSERARVESEEVIWGSESVRNTNVFRSNSLFPTTEFAILTHTVYKPATRALLRIIIICYEYCYRFVHLYGMYMYTRVWMHVLYMSYTYITILIAFVYSYYTGCPTKGSLF